MNQEESLQPESSELVNSSSQALLQANLGLMRSQAGYHTAIKVMKPRSLVEVQKNFLKECELAGESFFYSWPVKNKDGKVTIVEGKSFGLAKALMTHYTNCVCIPHLVDQDENFFYLECDFIDLENGTTTSRPFIQRKKIFSGPTKYQDERILEMALAIGVSKVKRNVILDGIPIWIAEEGMRVAKDSATKKITQNLPQARKGAIDSFQSMFNVSQKQLEDKIGLPESRWSSADVLSLRTMYQAIIGGEESVRSLFEVNVFEEEPKASTEKEKMPDIESGKSIPKKDKITEGYLDKGIPSVLGRAKTEKEINFIWERLTEDQKKKFNESFNKKLTELKAKSKKEEPESKEQPVDEEVIKEAKKKIIASETVEAVNKVIDELPVSIKKALESTASLKREQINEANRRQFKPDQLISEIRTYEGKSRKEFNLYCGKIRPIVDSYFGPDYAKVMSEIERIDQTTK